MKIIWFYNTNRFAQEEVPQRLHCTIHQAYSLVNFLRMNEISMCILVLSFFSAGFFVERLLFLRNQFQFDVDFLLQDCKEKIERSPEEAVSSLYDVSLFLGGISERLNKNKDRDWRDMEKIIQIDLKRMELFLNKRVDFISTVATVAPMLGLLGTVWGMIRSFFLLPKGTTEGMSYAIAMSLQTTAVGLIVAIFCIFSYNFLTKRIQKVITDTEILMTEFLLCVKGKCQK